MQFRVLGPVEAAAEGRRAELGSDRQRTILAVLLAARGAFVSADRLADALWGATPPPSARTSLRSHLSRLRRTLAAVDPGAPGAVVTEVDGYRVDLDAHTLDAARFEELVARARTVHASDPGKTLALVDEAEQLWRGPAFGDLAAHEAVHTEALRLEALRQSAVADRLDARLTLGAHDEALGELQARVAAEPLDERAHAQLMLALYRSGRQADALAAYRDLQRRLSEQLGIDPSPEVQELHERILRQDAGLAAVTRERPAVDFPPVSSREQTVAVLPGAGVEVVGRDADVAAVGALLVGASLVTLTGPGGIGKTRLAEQVAAAVAERFDDGVAVCGLAGVRDTGSVGEALLGALGIRHHADRRLDEALVAALWGRQLLLVLDNCEHLLAAVSPLAAALVARCPKLALLATSREPLRLPGERVWQVAPLAVPPAGVGPAEVTAAPAGALFCARAQAAAPGFVLTDANAATVAELCRRLDGMPLAIELAAARVRALAPTELLERIEDRFALLTGGPHHEGGRHRTLQAVVAWSYDLLEAREARLFDRLSVFAGSFPLGAAERVCAGDGLDASAVAGVLADLVDKSMVTVERSGEQVRYRLLDTLRDYGAARLAEAGDTAAYRGAHAAYHVALADELGPRLRSAEEGAALGEIDAVIDDLRAAHGWLLGTADIDRALRLPVALADYIFYRLRDEMVTWTERALALPGAASHPAYADARATAALGATNQGEFERARRHAESVLEQSQRDGLAAVRALEALATAALYEGRLDEVLVHADRMSALATALGEAFYAALAGLLRTLAHIYRGDDDAPAHAADLEATAEASGSPTMRAWARYSHGEALLEVAPAEAVSLLGEAVDLARDAGNPFVEGVALVSLASGTGRNDQTHRALELFRETVAHWRRFGDLTHQLTTLRNLVELLARTRPGESVAMLYGAVTGASPPSFGAEAGRLEAAWAQLEQHLGANGARGAAERGRHLTHAEAVEEALATLGALLDA